VYLQVWRKVSGKNYKLIGQNFVKKSVKGKNNKVNVRAKNRIVVKKGDFIGWTFVGKAAFGFSTSQGRVNWSRLYGVFLKTVGGTLNFPGSGRRLYQCRATVFPVRSSTKAAENVIVPSPLKTSFESKWGLDGWTSFSEVNTGYAIPSAGSINLWEYVAANANPVYLQVWRKVSGKNYKLIGQNFVKKSVKGKNNKVNVRAKNRIVVKKGDFIGWTFVGKAAFGFSTSQGRVNWSRLYGVFLKTVGGTLNFPGSGRRLYQCRASIITGKPSSGNKKPSGNKKSKVVVPAPLKTSYSRKRVLDGWQSFSEVNTAYPIPSAGSITLWEYLGATTSGVYLQVWRKVSGKNYKLIGQNFVKRSAKGKNNRVNVRANKRIVVKKGDFIGWSFVGKAAFGFSTSQGRTIWSKRSGLFLKTVGRTLNFPGSGKRLYQCRATVLPTN